MLCALGATSFAAAAAERPRRAVAVVAGMLAGALVATPVRLPDAVLVASGAGAVAVLQLFRPRWGVVTAFFAGVLGAAWSALMQAQGIPAVVAFSVGAAAPLAAIFL